MWKRLCGAMLTLGVLLALLPCRDGVEGFFIARMRRVSL